MHRRPSRSCHWLGGRARSDRRLRDPRRPTSVRSQDLNVGRIFPAAPCFRPSQRRSDLLASRFLEQRNRLLANVLKCFRGWPEEVFSREGANCVELTSPEAIEKQIVYTLANCVEAGLVETPNEWPGVRVLVEDIGRTTFAASRPTQYFTQNMPAEAALKISFPQALLEKYGSLARSREALARALRTRITSAKQAMISAGRSFKGVARVLCARFTSRSSTFEPFGDRVPSFSAAGNKEAARLAVAARRMFLDSYRSAFEAFRQGDRTTQFPYGTWRMLFVAGTRVATA